MTIPLDQLAGYPGALAWYHLGSVANGSERPDSDVDLALLPWPGVVPDRPDLVRWGGELALVLGREVDLGTIEGSNLVYAKEALTRGTLLWTCDAQATRRRSAEILALYLKFQEDRQGVLDAYRS